VKKKKGNSTIWLVRGGGGVLLIHKIAFLWVYGYKLLIIIIQRSINHMLMEK